MSEVPTLQTASGLVFGFQFDHLVDFLADHTLLGDTPSDRLQEHCARWTQVVAGLWTSQDANAAYALQFSFTPSTSYSERAEFPPPLPGAPPPAEFSGSATIRARMLVRAGDLYAAEAKVAIPRALDAFGLRPRLLSASELQAGQDVKARSVVEVRQREELLSVRPRGGMRTDESDRIYHVIPWWGPGGPFLSPMRALMSQRAAVTLSILLRPKELTEAEIAYLVRLGVTGRTGAVSATEVDTEGRIMDRRSDPMSEWLGNLQPANLRRLDAPFLTNVYVLSNDALTARGVGAAVVTMLNEERPFRGDDALTSVGCAEMVEFDAEESAEAARAHATLTSRASRQTLATSGRVEQQRLRYLMDARGASSVFRFPVSVRGGVPGIAVRQAPPDFHPGPSSERATSDEAYIGRFQSGGVAALPLQDFSKHVLITGFTGSGKTKTVLHLLHQFAEKGVPFLVLESAKQEYRGLITVPHFAGFGRLRVYTLGNETCVPFRLNPFEVMPGVRLEAHISRLQSCFEAALPPLGPLPSILEEALQEVYADRGWEITDVGQPIDASDARLFPTMTDLFHRTQRVIQARKYAGEIEQNLTAAILGRIKPLTTLMRGSKGWMFDTQRCRPTPDVLFEQPVILEMNDLNQQDKALAVLFLLTMLREHRERNPSQPRGRLAHVTVVEEAHNVLENVSSSAGGGEGGQADTRYRAVQSFCNMLAEIRSYGEGLFIADQSPSKLAPDAIRNTNVQISHQLRDGRDREAMAEAMLMTDEQRDYLGKLVPGEAAIFYTGLQRATFVRVPRYDTPGGAGEHYSPDITDAVLAEHMLNLPDKYRQAIAAIDNDASLRRRFGEVYRDLRDECMRPVTSDGMWAELAKVAAEGASAAGHPHDADAAWCYLVHRWRQHCTLPLMIDDRSALFKALGNSFNSAWSPKLTGDGGRR